MKVTYNSNNSGGGWWLKDEDWHKLEKAGWKVDWHAETKKDSLFSVVEDGRWLGALATTAHKEFDSLYEAVREWEELVGQDASDEGCNCCGPPHAFYTDDEVPKGESSYVSGKEIAYLMEGSDSITLREALRKIKGGE